jgi:branched-chain amino acid transport system substrate-binding protein
MTHSIDPRRRRALQIGAAAALAGAWPFAASAKGVYDVGANDKEIKLGNLVPYSGPASAYGLAGKAEDAYFKMVNATGGVNGRRINFISLDDAYSPPRAVEMTRKLVEQEEVLCMFAPLGTPSNMATRKYLNSKKVPQLFVNTGATQFGDYKQYPWTMAFYPSYQVEGRIFARHILDNHPNAKIAVLRQSDDAGKDYEKGLMDGLGEKAKTMVAAHETYETTDATIDSQLVKLQASGCDVFFCSATPKFAAMAIRKAAELKWKPVFYMVSVGASIESVFRPAGLENAKGIITTSFMLETSSPEAAGNKDMAAYLAWMKQYYPSGNPDEAQNILAFAMCATMVQVLKQCGDELTRANVMKQAANLKNFAAPLLWPGIVINTSPTDYYPIEQKIMTRFNGQKYETISKPIAG